MKGKTNIYNVLRYKPEDHTYWGSKGIYHIPTNAFIEKFEKPFDSNLISHNSARGEFKRKGVVADSMMISKRARELRDEWAAKGDFASRWGTDIHEYLRFSTAGELAVQPKEWPGDFKQLSDDIMVFYNSLPIFQFYNEIVLGIYEPFGIGGTCDRINIRESIKSSICDFIDYKFRVTDKKESIANSVLIRNGKFKHLNKFFLYPLDHIENCKYTRAAIQMSIYAYMAEKTFGARVGSLITIEITYDEHNDRYNFKPMFTPYMKSDVQKMFTFAIESKDVFNELTRKVEEDNW